jgi:ParB family transcriptional regulator, chromosome partitioning protein
VKNIEMIPIAHIRLLNPRVRNKAKFQDIVTNISRVGLKKPITVARREGQDGAYDLVCGQGRLEAFVALGQSEVPAIVVEAPKEDRYLMSLVENLARRPPSSIELVREIQAQRERGYSHSQIAAKLGLSDGYVSLLQRLIDKGEERLIQAVERGEIPVAVAIEIAGSDDATVQRSLADAYTSGQLRGKALFAARRLVELRCARGKGFGASRSGRKEKARVTTDELVSTYRKETQRQKLLVKKARVCETQLVFTAGALRRLLEEELFVSLLRAEALDALPEYIADAIRRPTS